MKFSSLFIVITLFLATLLSGCTSHYSFYSNLDPQNFSDYFAPASVTIFEDESQFPGNYHFVGTVEGLSCQAKAHLAKSSEVNARTHARRQAAELGANSIIFTGCTVDQTPSCLEVTACYGKAYKILLEQNDD
jgi:RcsF protein